MALVYSYIRFSTTKQANGDSLRRQQEGEKWIEDNKHTKASLTLHDLGVSAFRGANKHAGALRTFLDLVESGKVEKGSILLVEHLDRLSREGVQYALPLFLQIINAGVRIAVLKPTPYVYGDSQDTNQQLIELLMPLVYFHLAHVESVRKSDNLGNAWKEKRRKAVENGEKFDRRCPSWLKWSEDEGKFVKKPGWEAIPFIYRKAAEGWGQTKTLEALQSQFTPLGWSGSWNSSFIQSVLNNPSVRGIRKQYTFNEEGKRIPAGDPIEGYYPRVVEDPLYYDAQAKKKGRSRNKGPDSEFVNVFKGLLINANDESAFHCASSSDGNGGRQRRLVSYKHKKKKVGADPTSVDYEQVERAVLFFLRELTIEDVRPIADQSQLVEKLQEKAGILARLSELESEVVDPQVAGLPTVLRSVERLERKKSEIDEEIERLRQDEVSGEPLDKAQTLLQKLDSTTGDDLQILRLKLRSVLATLIESIYVKPEKWKGRVYAIVQVNLVDGRFRHIIVGDGHAAAALEPLATDTLCPVLDLRNPASAKWSLFSGLRLQEAIEGEPIPKDVPKQIGDAAEVWLRIAKRRMSPESFRVVPSKVRRFVEVVGPGTLCQDIDKKAWDRFVRSLKRLVKRGDLAQNTARVSYSRSREFVRWLISEGIVQEWSGLWKSSARVLG